MTSTKHERIGPLECPCPFERFYPRIHRLGAPRTTMPRRLTNHPVEWFADDTGTVLGAIAYETREFAWSVVILGRDALGMFRAFDRDISVGRLVVRGGCSSTGWCRRWRW